jgi:hypothetical protein
MTTIHASRLPNETGNSGYISVVWFAAIFALVTYAAISLRAVLSPYEVNSFIDAKRAFSVILGAIILGVAMRAAERTSGQSLGTQIIAVLNVAIPGAIGLLLAREAYDLATSGEFALRLALNVRWMLTWIGYFAAAVAGFLALGFYRQLQVVTAQNMGVRDFGSTSAPLATTAYEIADIDFDPRSTT